MQDQIVSRKRRGGGGALLNRLFSGGVFSEANLTATRLATRAELAKRLVNAPRSQLIRKIR